MSPVYQFKRAFAFFGVLPASVRWLAAGSFALLMLAGCSILPKTTPARVYQLPGAIMPSIPAQTPAESAPSLRVLTPSSPLILSSNRILVMSAPNQLAAFKGVRWSDPMPQLFQRRLVNYLRESKKWRVVTTENTPLSTDYQLILSLAQFHAIRMPQRIPGVEIRVDAILSNRSQNKAIASRTFVESTIAESDAFNDLLAAYGEAGNALAAKISKWAQQQAR